MKLSDILNLIAAILTFLFIVFLILKDMNSLCFSWIEYWISFATLLANVLINILAAIGR